MVQIKCFTVNPVQENTYVLYDETKEAAIVDCGCMSTAEEEALARFIEQEGLSPKLLLCTHLHFDHVWGNAWAMRKWSLEAYCHADDLSMPPKPSQQLALFGIHSPLENLPDEAYHLVNQGDRIRFGNTELEVRHIPGHAPGHVAFYAERGRLVLSGDALFAGDIGRTDLWCGSYEALINSVRTQLFTLPHDTVVYPGHGPATTIGEEIAHNPYFRN